MSQFLIITGGLLLCAALFWLSRQESCAQRKQVVDFFGEVVLSVSYKAENGAWVEKDFPVVSTSIICGNENKGEKHHLDFPVPTEDETMEGTAVEFFVEPDAGNLRLYVRLLEQQEIWIKRIKRGDKSANKTVAMFVVKDKKKYQTPKNTSAKKQDLPEPPKVLFGGKPCQVRIIRKQKQVLHVGDKILVGASTVFEVKV